MSKREWKPGDVALVTIGRRRGDGSDEATYTAFFAGAYGWYGVSDGEGCGGLTANEDEFVITRRPLAVIDPEDREQVERLTAIYTQQPRGAFLSDTSDDMQAALREFANPTDPKPDEPQGLGAVVEDADGELWVRVGVTIGDLHWRSTEPGNTNCFKWRAINAVRILSEGVTQ